MIVGMASTIAIEFSISNVYGELNPFVEGFFNVHIKGYRYGMRADRATMLNASYDEVQKRVREQGLHAAPFAEEAAASEIADLTIKSLYGDQPASFGAWGMTQDELNTLIYSNDLLWAPDGDAAFDDRAHIFQFDVDERVRVISFQRGEDQPGFEPTTLRDLWVASSEYYGLLSSWIEKYEEAITAAPRLPQLRPL